MGYWGLVCGIFFFFKQKTAYDMRISDWSSDVCSSDLSSALPPAAPCRKSNAATGRAAVIARMIWQEHTHYFYPSTWAILSPHIPTLNHRVLHQLRPHCSLNPTPLRDAD